MRQLPGAGVLIELSRRRDAPPPEDAELPSDAADLLDDAVEAVSATMASTRVTACQGMTGRVTGSAGQSSAVWRRSPVMRVPSGASSSTARTDSLMRRAADVRGSGRPVMTHSAETSWSAGAPKTRATRSMRKVTASPFLAGTDGLVVSGRQSGPASAAIPPAGPVAFDRPIG